MRAKKGAEGRDEMNTESTEYSKSGSDAQSAAQQEAAFEKGNTSPEGEMEKAGEGKGVSSFTAFVVLEGNGEIMGEG